LTERRKEMPIAPPPPPEELADHNVMLRKKERRERIATAVMHGLMASGTQNVHLAKEAAQISLAWADALIAKLDKGRHMKVYCCYCEKPITEERYAHDSDGDPWHYKCYQGFFGLTDEEMEAIQ
jgi:hypothetical protein